jgi:phosphate butyryltransferase
MIKKILISFDFLSLGENHMKCIKDIIDKASKETTRVLSVAAAHDEDVLRAIVNARKSSIISVILIGDADRISRILRAFGEKDQDYRIVDAPMSECAEKAVEFVKSGEAGFLMKGLIGTTDLMRAVVKSDTGLRTENLISHVMLYEVPGYPEILALTDGGMNTFPDLEKKRQILHNAAGMLKILGYSEIVAACICGTEVVNPKVQSTIDAEKLAAMTEQWKAYNMQVIGPVGFDLAISEKACKQKGYRQEGGGNADILLVPSYEMGNGIGKALTYFAGAKSAGLILGAQVPIVLASRADGMYTKLSSVALGCLLCD